jgi:hypothetical protein
LFHEVDEFHWTLRHGNTCLTERLDLLRRRA